MKIRITMEIADEYADPDHDMGVSEEGYNAICEALGDLGSDVDVRRDDES